MPKLTEGFAAKLKVPHGKRDVLVFDSDHRDAVAGFGIRKFASGKAYYFVKYRVNGKQRRQSLREVTDGNLKAMRAFAAEVKARASVLGQDLVAERRAERSRPANILFGGTVPVYLAARENQLRGRSYGEIKRYLENAWKPLHRMAVDAIKRSDVVAVLDDLEQDSGPVAADRAKTALSGFFAWAISDGYAKGPDGRRVRLEANPAMNIDPRARNGPRSRTLSDSELAEVWHACGDDDHGRITRLLILTGQRKSEIGNLEWPEINPTDRQIELPEARTKNHRRHVIPLADAAWNIISSVPRRSGRDLLFGGGNSGFSAWSKAKSLLDSRIAEARAKAGNKRPMPAWVLHDLRRTFVTRVNECGFADPHVTEAVINHVSGHKAGIAGRYNHASYALQKREALELWAKHVTAIVSEERGKVVPLSHKQRPAIEKQQENGNSAASGTRA